jgi:hypothetical protein
LPIGTDQYQINRTTNKPIDVVEWHTFEIGNTGCDQRHELMMQYTTIAPVREDGVVDMSNDTVGSCIVTARIVYRIATKVAVDGFDELLAR